MPYPRSCPLCSARYPDERSHISLGSRHIGGHTVIRLMCKHCGGYYHWHFQGARVVPMDSPEGAHSPVASHIWDPEAVGSIERYLREFQTR